MLLYVQADASEHDASSAESTAHDKAVIAVLRSQLTAAETAASKAQAALAARTAQYSSDTAALQQQLASANAATATAAGATGAAAAATTSPRHTVQPLSIVTGSTAAMAAAPAVTNDSSSGLELAQLKAQLVASSNAVAVLEQQLSDSKTHVTQLLAAHQVTVMCSCCDTLLFYMKAPPKVLPCGLLCNTRSVYI